MGDNEGRLDREVKAIQGRMVVAAKEYHNAVAGLLCGYNKQISVPALFCPIINNHNLDNQRLTAAMRSIKNTVRKRIEPPRAKLEKAQSDLQNEYDNYDDGPRDGEKPRAELIWLGRISTVFSKDMQGKIYFDMNFFNLPRSSMINGEGSPWIDQYVDMTKKLAEAHQASWTLFTEMQRSMRSNHMEGAAHYHNRHVAKSPAAHIHLYKTSHRERLDRFKKSMRQGWETAAQNADRRLHGRTDAPWADSGVLSDSASLSDSPSDSELSDSASDASAAADDSLEWDVRPARA